MERNTKFYSDRQEALIAKYLGWNKVTGSGSRPTFVGDIESESWLGECKTHMAPGHKLIFKFHVWDKLEKEAISRFKDPVLVVDDGSQEIKNTFVMLKLKRKPEGRDPLDYSDRHSFRFDNLNEYKLDYVTHEFTRNGDYYIVLWLPSFKNLVSRTR